MRVETRPVLMLLPVWPDACNCPHLAADCSPPDSHLGARSNGKSHTLWDSRPGFGLLLVLVLVFSLCFALLDWLQPHAGIIMGSPGLMVCEMVLHIVNIENPMFPWSPSAPSHYPTIPDTSHLFVAMRRPCLFCYKMKAERCLSGDLISIPACNTLPCHDGRCGPDNQNLVLIYNLWSRW